ncbi:MAG TPA: PilN domain-containing protein, partial [Rhodanobacteraceae bacterium]|nr:PilN domain-containing protein [Rhodanobacteraceae bacterium]
ERRKVREREFYGMLGMAALAGIAIVLGWVFWMSHNIEVQNGRNSYLQAQIKQLDAKIAEIKDLEKTRDRLLARKQIIEQLQANRSQMVHLFDELVKTIPDSVRLTDLAQNGENLHLDGVAQSNASVATYLRNLEASHWLGGTDLKKTENKDTDSSLPYVFSIDLKLTKPEEKNADGGESGSTKATGGKS